MATPSRPVGARPPTPDRNAQPNVVGAQLVRQVRRAAALTARALRAAASWLAHLWRASLQFRVIVITMLLGLLVVLMLGSYLYQSIADGLTSERIRQAQGEASQGTRSAQLAFDASDRTDSVSLTQLASDLARQLRAPGEELSREVIITRALANQRESGLSTVQSGPIGTEAVPPNMREAIAKDPSHQQRQITTVTEDGRVLPAVLIGSRITVPVAGQYEIYFVFPMQREQETLAVVRGTFYLGGLALVLLLGGVAYVVTRLVVDPVRRAALVAERLSSGRLNERMRARGEDDLARLGKSFNEMADNLQMQIRQLEDLSRLQQRFVADVSHELRTPLTTIRMAGDLLHDSRGDFDPSVARSVELLHNEIDRFESLLSDLLEISRFDAGAAALEVEPTDLRVTAVRAVESTTALAKRRGSEVRLEAANRPCIAEIDPRRIERVLRNLVVNAIEHGDGRPVSVRVAVNETAVAVAVRDHGVGLRPGETALVFNRFWRADPARARTSGGTGLGLAISLEDALLHAGWLQAWGEPGMGSCFRLTVPRKAGVPIQRSPLPLSPDEATGAGPAPSADTTANRTSTHRPAQAPT